MGFRNSVHFILLVTYITNNVLCISKCLTVVFEWTITKNTINRSWRQKLHCFKDIIGKTLHKIKVKMFKRAYLRNIIFLCHLDLRILCIFLPQITMLRNSFLKFSFLRGKDSCLFGWPKRSQVPVLKKEIKNIRF